MSDRDRGYLRKMRSKVIHRRKNISRQVYNLDWYPYDGQYSKGKVHCGCGLCKPGKRFGYPTIYQERQNERESILMQDYYSNL